MSINAAANGQVSPRIVPSATPAPTVPLVVPALDSAARAYIDAAAGQAGRRCRRRGVVGFVNRYGNLDVWLALPVQERRETRSDVMAFVGHALVHCHGACQPFCVRGGRVSQLMCPASRSG